LVGHSLEHDLHVLHLSHHHVIDTVLLYDDSGAFAYKKKLRSLALDHLSRVIQAEGQPHDPCDDAQAAMALAQLKRLEAPPEAPPGELRAGAGGVVHTASAPDDSLIQLMCTSADIDVVALGPPAFTGLLSRHGATTTMAATAATLATEIQHLPSRGYPHSHALGHGLVLTSCEALDEVLRDVPLSELPPAITGDAESIWPGEVSEDAGARGAALDAHDNALAEILHARDALEAVMQATSGTHLLMVLGLGVSWWFEEERRGSEKKVGEGK
jgi:hypothetical protein